jgi:hypothetical protein
MANTALPNIVAQGPAQAQARVLDARKELQASAAKRRANWFYWIAGLSVINSQIVLGGSTSHFVVGLGITEIFDFAGKGLRGPGEGVALFFSIGIAVVFAVFGYFANKLQQWSFLVGMIPYALDGLLLLSFSDFLSVGFHALVLCFLFKGFSAASNYATLRPANASLG